METQSAKQLNDKALCAQLLYRMVLVNRFEQEALRQLNRGQVYGTMHLCIGEEAACIGTTAALGQTDYLLATHRGHGQAIGKGVDVKEMMAELMGRATGTNRGKGGSMHICDYDNGMLGANGILGANGPIACGAALTIKMKKIPDRVVACFFGDGTSNQGAMHEAMNLAAVWKLPVLFVLTNNTYGMSTPLRRAVNDTDLTKRAIPFGIKAYECDGNDVLAVYRTVQEARRYALENGPVLIVEQTYRTCGHSRSDTNLYRTEEEIRYWQDRNPILRFRQQLMESGTLSAQEMDALQRQAEEAVAEAVTYALAQPEPKPEDLENDVYAH